MSDESEDEDDPLVQHLLRIHLTHGQEEVCRNSIAWSHRQKNINETSSDILPKDDLFDEETGEHTAQADRAPFTSGPPRRSSRSPNCSDRHSPRPHSAFTSADAIRIVAPTPVVPIGDRMVPKTTSPKPAVRFPSVTRDIFAASGTGQRSRQPSQQNSLSSGGRGSAGIPAQLVHETGAQNKVVLPPKWTVDEVVEWLKSKGFGPDVYDRFIEQDITGDVLFELDINLLKAEIGIVAFGKRMRIVNAIAELRRPPSISPSEHQHVPSIARSASLSYAPGRPPSRSTQRSVNSPMFMGMGSTFNEPSSSALAGRGSPESPGAGMLASPFVSRRLSSAGTSVSGGTSAAAGIERAGLTNVVGLGLVALPEAQSVSAASESVLVTTEEKSVEIEDEGRSARSKIGTAPTQQHRHVVGRSVGSSGSDKDKERSRTLTPSDAKSFASSIVAASSRRKPESPDRTGFPGYTRSKHSADVGEGTERRGLFGWLFTTSTGRSKKHSPSALSTFEISNPTEKTVASGSGLHSGKKPSRRPQTSDGLIPSRLRNFQWTTDSNLIDWANSHLRRSYRVTDPTGPLFDGLALLRLAEDVIGKSASPPIPDSALPSGPDDDKLDGLFRLFEFLLDNDVIVGTVSIDDVRRGERAKVMKLLQTLRTWEDRRKETVKGLGKGVIQAGSPIDPLQHCLLP